MAVYHQDVEHLFPERGVCSQLTLAQPGDDVSGGYAAVLLDHFLPLFPEHGDGLVGQPRHLLRGGLDRVGSDQVSVPGDDGLCLVDLWAGVVDMLPGLGYAFFQRPDVGQRGGVPGRLLRGSGPEAPFVKVVCCVCQGVELG